MAVKNRLPEKVTCCLRAAMSAFLIFYSILKELAYYGSIKQDT